MNTTVLADEMKMDMGMDMDMMMYMTFYQSNELTLLFKNLKSSDNGTYFGLLFLIFAMGFTIEALGYLRFRSMIENKFLAN